MLVNRFGTICFEDLNIKGMLHNHNLAKSISDVAWKMLVNITSYKAESAGSKVILVDPRNSSRCALVVVSWLKNRYLIESITVLSAGCQWIEIRMRLSIF